jgi:hypothetical protein
MPDHECCCRGYVHLIDMEKFSKVMLIILGMIVLIKGVSMFWVGFHNMDLCINEMSISKCYDISAYETTLGGGKWSFQKCYFTGLNQVITGFFISISGAFLVGAFLFKD